MSSPASPVAIMYTSRLSCHLHRSTPSSLPHFSDSPRRTRFCARPLGNHVCWHEWYHADMCRLQVGEVDRREVIVRKDTSIARQVTAHQLHDKPVAKVHAIVVVVRGSSVNRKCYTVAGRRVTQTPKFETPLDRLLWHTVSS